MQSTRVTFYNDAGQGTSYATRLVAVDPSKDLAVLKIDAPRGVLRPAPLGTSGDLKVGQSVYAIGNPSGLSRTLTTGVVSGLNRGLPSPTGLRIPGVIQTDCQINGGTCRRCLHTCCSCCTCAVCGLRVHLVAVMRPSQVRNVCRCAGPVKSVEDMFFMNCLVSDNSVTMLVGARGLQSSCQCQPVLRR